MLRTLSEHEGGRPWAKGLGLYNRAFSRINLITQNAHTDENKNIEYPNYFFSLVNMSSGNGQCLDTTRYQVAKTLI